jgi:hypothetical protein
LAAAKLDDIEITAFFQRKWGKNPDAISFPGGSGRKTALAQIDGRTYAISKRGSIGRAQLEATALTRLNSSGAVPALVVQDGLFVIQEAIFGERLSQKLELASEDCRDQILISAGKSLLALQGLGKVSGLLKMVPKIGARPG